MVTFYFSFLEENTRNRSENSSPKKSYLLLLLPLVYPLRGDPYCLLQPLWVLVVVIVVPPPGVEPAALTAIGLAERPPTGMVRYMGLTIG